jgi:hypothetical protein
LIYLWRNGFLKKEAEVLFYFFCLVAFSGTILIDLRSGNTNLIEQFFLWVGFLFYLKRRSMLFCIFVLLAASFKLAPAFFLILLLFSEDRKKYLYFFGSVCVVLGYMAVQYIAMPQLFVNFLHNALNVFNEPGGQICPSTSYLIRDLVLPLGSISFPLPWPLPGKLLFFFVLVALAAAIVVSVSLKALLRLRKLNTEDSRRMLLFFVCLIYALIHPRFKDYYYILLIVPVYFIIRRPRFEKFYPFLFVIAIFSSVCLPFLNEVTFITEQYYSLLIAYGAWGLY